MATAQLVEDAPVRQPQKPWTKAALLRIECTGSPPDGQENFLHEFLGGRSLQTLQGQVKHQPRVAAVERAKRLMQAGGELQALPCAGHDAARPGRALGASARTAASSAAQYASVLSRADVCRRS